jgi:hypothetical protein
MRKMQAKRESLPLKFVTMRKLDRERLGVVSR